MKQLERGIELLSKSLVLPYDAALPADALTALTKHERQLHEQQKALWGIVEGLEDTVELEGPFTLEHSNGKENWTREATREELLEHYLFTAIDAITNILEDE